MKIKASGVVWLCVCVGIFYFAYQKYESKHHHPTTTQTTQAPDPGIIQAPQEDCIVLAVGGNKLCGSDAASWCRSTDTLRAESGQYPDPTCRDLENKYP